MDEAEKAATRMHARVYRLELTLQNRIKACKALLPESEVDSICVTPSRSMNSTYEDDVNASSTPLKSSTVIRRSGSSTSASILDDDKGAASNRRNLDSRSRPFVIMQELHKLRETFNSYDQTAQDYYIMLDEESPAAERAGRRHGHHIDIAEKMIERTE